MLTGLLIIWPLIAGLFLLPMKGENVKKIAFGTSLVQLVFSFVAWYLFQNNAVTQFAIDVPWVESLGIHFSIGMDGISLLMVLLTNFLVPLIILSSFDKKHNNESLFYGLILIMQMALVGVFVALDGFLFYIFWELALIPIYLIVLMWGGENRGRITLKFFIYTLTGSLAMLVALIYIYLQTPGTHSFDIITLYETARGLGGTEQGLLFWGFFLAFAIKMPIVPFHTWQPETYDVAPTAGTMLLSGIMVKMGLYGVIRWIMPMLPEGIAQWGTLAIALGVIGVVYASSLALVQRNFKKMIAYSSIAHVGLMAAGIFVYNSQGLNGGIIQMITHGINVIGLFFIMDIVLTRTGSKQMDKLGGIRTKAPVLATVFMIVLLGTIALPITNGFVGEFLLITGLFIGSGWIAAGFATTTVIFSSVYMFRAFQRIMLGETNELTENFTDLTFRERAVLFPIAFMVIFIGVYPKPFMDMAAPAVEFLINNYPL